MSSGRVSYPPSLNRVVALKLLCDLKKSPANPCTCYQENYNDPHFVHDHNCIVREAQDTWGCIDVLFEIIPTLDPYHKDSVLREYMNNDSFEENPKNSQITPKILKLRDSMVRFFSETVHFYRKNPELYKKPTPKQIYQILQLNRIPVEFYNLVQTDLEYCKLLLSDMEGCI